MAKNIKENEKSQILLPLSCTCIWVIFKKMKTSFSENNLNIK